MTLLYDPSTRSVVESSIQPAPKYGLLVPNRLFVGGLGSEITEDELKSFFSSYGAVRHCKILSDNNGMSKGYGFVTFVTTEDVEKLLKNEGEQMIYKDRKLNIGPAVRKQGTLPQVLGSTHTAAATAGQSGVMYANGVPYVVQGTSPKIVPLPQTAAMLPFQEGMTYPQLVGMPSGVQMMMLHPQYLAQPTALVHAGPTGATNAQATVGRGSLQFGGSLPFHVDSSMGIPQILASSPGINTSTAALLQGIAQQQLILPTTPTFSGGSPGLEQYLCQLPYMIQQQSIFPQQQTLLQQHLQTSDVLAQQLSGIETLQQKLQQQKPHLTLAEGISNQLQYVELPQNLAESTTCTTSGVSLQAAPLQSGSSTTTKNTDSPMASLETKSIGIKRVLNIPYQTVCSPSYAGSMYGLPAVKILAGQGQQRIVTQALDPSDIQVLAKNLK